jgi:hypothetical protein
MRFNRTSVKPRQRPPIGAESAVEPISINLRLLPEPLFAHGSHHKGAITEVYGGESNYAPYTNPEKREREDDTRYARALD